MRFFVKHVSRLIEQMLSYLREVEVFGLTGEIKFDADGFRTDFQLDLMEKHRSLYKEDFKRRFTCICIGLRHRHTSLYWAESGMYG